HEGEVVQASPCGHAQGRHRPDEGLGWEAEYPFVRANHLARDEESDPGDHAPEERERILILQIDGEDRQRAGAGRDEDERAEPDRLPPELPLESDTESEKEHDDQANYGFGRLHHSSTIPSSRRVPVTSNTARGLFFSFVR